MTSNRALTVDQYDRLAWVVVFSDNPLPENLQSDLTNQGIEGAVVISKSNSGPPSTPSIWFGEVPETLTIEEHHIRYEIRTKSSHPGLFLDHSLTRKWLLEHSRDRTVLNLFSFTGSLGICAAVGGAKESLNLDLSGATTEWAKKNAMLNQLGAQHQFVKGDVFDWLERFKKKNREFDIVISDPPSQSRSPTMHFSTEKHLDRLHELCVTSLCKSGTLITSINTETLSHKVLEASLINTAKKLNRRIKRMEHLALPHGFDPNFRTMRGIRAVIA